MARRLSSVPEHQDLVPGDANATYDVFVKKLTTGAIRIGSSDAAGAPATGGSDGHGSFGPLWSPDGTKIVFASEADNLVWVRLCWRDGQAAVVSAW